MKFRRTTCLATRRKGPILGGALMVAVAGLSGCSSSNSSGPGQVAAKYLAAYSKSDLKTACQYGEPAYQAECATAAGLGAYSGKDLKVHQVVTSGDEALVAVTGTICINSTCHTVSDPTSGMPNQTTPFDQAWGQAMNGNISAATPMKRVSGKWYIAQTKAGS
ncbi:MAG: hypothetical protein M3Y49_05380 [Actinomycetota bacterium]|nr:hypothetical protein [Actinomycetota bacterium]